MRTRKTPPMHTHKEREIDGGKEIGPTRFVCWMRAIELKIVGEREREQESGRGGVTFRYKLAFKYLNWRTCCLQSTHERIYAYIKQVH